ncbi:MAG: septum formation initiator family protein [Candidatus Sungiibacteriota bacterium]
MWKKIKTSLPLNILIAVGIIAAASGLFKIAREVIILRSEYAATRAQIEVLRNERPLLSARIAEMETAEAIEREAKGRLNLKKKGEQVVVVVPEKAVEITMPNASWWLRVRDFFGGMF